MKKQQKCLIELDSDQLRDFCSRLPLEESDQKIAYALATLCVATGSYTPSRGVGQKEIARLAGVGVRTVKRRLDYLVRYGILSIERLNGRSNCYHFDLVMMIQAPAPTHNLYKYIKSKPAKQPPRPVVKTNDRQRLLFADQAENEVETTAPAGVDKYSLLSRMTGAVVQFTKRMFTSSTADLPAETGAIDSEPGPSSRKPGPTRHEPGPSSQDQPLNRGQTGAIVSGGDSEPGPSENVGAEKYAEPGPTGVQSSGEPGPNRGQLPVHVHGTYMEKEALIKNSMIHNHEHVGLGGFSLRRVAKPENSSKPPPRKRVNWGGREISDDDLQNPHEVQELYQIALAQGVCKHSESAQEDFFRLASYASRYKDAKNRGGLFSSLLGHLYDTNIKKPIQACFAHEDDEWARKAIPEVTLPPTTTATERINS